jgi:hypothetical protein
MGRGGQGSAAPPCFTLAPPPSICPPPSVVQGLYDEGDMGQTRVSPFRLKNFFAYKRNKANLDPFHMCFTISLLIFTSLFSLLFAYFRFKFFASLHLSNFRSEIQVNFFGFFSFFHFFLLFFTFFRIFFALNFSLRFDLLFFASKRTKRSEIQVYFLVFFRFFSLFFAFFCIFFTFFRLIFVSLRFFHLIFSYFTFIFASDFWCFASK